MSQAVEISPATLAERSHRTVAHRNNFDLLRHGFAILVIFSHSFPLALGDESAEPLVIATRNQSSFGALAVNGFFIISGFLITQSWFRSTSCGEFLVKRVLRIYPGFYGSVAFSFFVAVLCSYPASLFYIKHTFQSYYANIIEEMLFPRADFLNRDYLLVGNPLPGKINVSLWTLRPELCCYLLVAGLGLSGLLVKRWPVAGAAVVVTSLHYANVVSGRTDENLCRFGMCFLVGAVLSLYRDLLPRLTLLRAVACLSAILLSARVGNFFGIITPVIGGYLVIGFGSARQLPGTSLFTRIDTSYGIYLYASPVQQAIVFMIGVRDPYLLFAIATPLTIVLAIASWFAIESPAMGMRNRFASYIK